MAIADALHKMLQRAHSARGDDRHGDRISNGAGERDVEALFRAVAIHGGQQDFAGPERHYFARVIDGIEAGGIAAAMGEDFPTLAFSRLRDALGIDRHDDALVTEFFRCLLYECASGNGCGVDRHLVGAGREQVADIFDRAHPAPHGERHEAGLGGAPHHIEDDPAILVARRDIEKRELVGAGRVIGDRCRDRIAGVAQVEKLDALDDAAILDVETGNDANFEHAHALARADPMSRSASAGSSRPS